MSGNRGKSGRSGAPLPERPVPAYKAARLLACSSRQLRRYHEQGKLRQWRHPDRTGYVYDLDEIEAMRAEFVEVTR